MSFKDGVFSDRYLRMGDEAEKIFEETYAQGYVRHGLNRPPIQLGTVPAFARFAPDYLTSKGYVEVQGFGRDQVAKFKTEKIEALCAWHHHFRVDFFLWDSHMKRYGWARLQQLINTFTLHDVRLFPEGTQYFALPAERVPVIEWVKHGDPLAVER